MSTTKKKRYINLLPILKIEGEMCFQKKKKIGLERIFNHSNATVEPERVLWRKCTGPRSS